ncbi:endonuclease/exonuclease/phosphatase family protein [Opitutus terrae]|uniref:Endonuclease/exonuclease/phosphatase n=1 Tax=Opitutus terrae (strain DSM 11246 / JCM 15787 / PB90-1) TaxID=452637 RepID=B1ZXI0_OPITP|nr:endonuclease/exonuclease/phosphatase family protein [Opitutus terrae]ACB76975.1 Endonuclease/exonuclease/phosphatase [Opitutus terrae PB90-1]
MSATPRLDFLLRALAAAALFFTTLSSLRAASTDRTTATAPLALRVMSFNLRFASPQPPHAWPERRPIMQHVIEQTAPDLIGTQEGLYTQLRDLAADLPAYEWIGLGREGGSRGEFMAVFYRRERFEPVAFDHFWLSDTPDVIGSMTWGNNYRRMVTWVRFRERASGREFYFWNTHFDHEVETARQKAAILIRDRLAQLDASVPLLLVGDFNCAAGNSPAYETLTREAGLTDTWTAATARVNEGFNTFHNYEPPRHDGVRIDWILARTPSAVPRAEIVTYRENGQTPSDHFPVLADVQF